MLQWKRDIFLGASILIFSVINLFYANTMKKSSIQFGLAQPDNYVKLWLAIYLLLAVLLIIRSLKKRPTNTLPAMWSRASILTVVLSVIYLLVLPYFGFTISTIIFLSFTGVMYTYFVGEKVFSKKTIIFEAIRWGLYATLVTYVMYFLFSRILHVVLPSFSIF